MPLLQHISNKKHGIAIGFALSSFILTLLSLLAACTSPFSPDNITISKTEIKNNRSFINPITIEKLKVDSLNEDQRPSKYTIQYITTCAITQKEGKPPVGLKKIELNQPGRYSWSENNVNIPIDHSNLQRKRLDHSNDIIWAQSAQFYPVCPMKFENSNWYFVTFHDPQIIGIYIYIDHNGNLEQHTIYSGVSPI